MLDDLDLEIDLGPVADLLSHIADAMGDALPSDVVDAVFDAVDGLEMPTLGTTSSSAASPSSGPSPGRTAPPSRPG
jgi:hypothetical protein